MATRTNHLSLALILYIYRFSDDGDFAGLTAVYQCFIKYCLGQRNTKEREKIEKRKLRLESDH